MKQRSRNMDDERKKNSEDKNSGVQSIEAVISVAHVYAEKLEKYNYKKKQRAKKLRKHAAEDRAVQKSESNPQSKASQRAQIKKEAQRKVQNRSSKEAANQFGDISRKFVDKAEDLTGKFAEFITEHFEESFVVMVVMVLILVIGALFSSCGSALTGTSHVGVTTSYTSDDEDIYEVEDDYRELEEALQELIDNAETDHPGYDEYQYYLDNIGHNPYQLAAVLTVLYEQYKDSYVRGTLAEIFERQYYLSFNSVTETRTDEDTGAQYEYRILKVTLVNRTLDTVIRGLGLSADQMARYAGCGYKTYEQEVNVHFSHQDVVTPEAATLSIHPNPTNDVINIAIENVSSNVQIALYNAVGQMIYSTSENVEHALNTTINLSDLSAGSYILQIRSDENVWTKKIIKR